MPRVLPARRRARRSHALAPLALAVALGGEPVGPAAPPPVRLAVPEGVGRLVYAWDGGPPVTWEDPPRRVTLPWGEAGRVAGTLHYDPFAGGEAPGRFGGGRALGPGEPLAVELDGVATPWTVDLWVRPEGGGGGAERWLEAPGAFTLGREADGRLALRSAAAGGLVVRSAAPVVAGAWHHVGVAADGPELSQVRLVVDGAPAGRVPERPLPAWTRLVVGGDARLVVDELRVLERALTTDELAERSAPPAAPGMHELRAELGGVERVVRTWAGVVTEPAVDGERGFALGAREHLAPRGGALRWTPGQWERDRPDVRPLARTTHPTVYVGDHRVLVYGGETRDTHLPPMVNTDDTWLYRADRRAWRRVAADGPAPSPRCHQPAAYDPGRGLVLLAGGWRNDAPEKVALDDTWVFHVDEERWERREPEGRELRASSGAALVHHPGLDRFLLLQGRRLRAYDPDADRWQALPFPRVDYEAGEEPDEVPYVQPSSPMVGYDPGTGLVVLFGGVRWVDDAQDFRDRTVHWDVEAGTMLVKRVGDAPSPRVRSAFAYDARRGRFVLFGGVRDQFSERQDDLWTYGPAAARWERVDAADGPGARGGYYGMAYDPDLDRFLVLCGRAAPDRFLNEAWRLRLDPEAEGRGSWVFDRAALAGLGHLRCDLRLPDGAEAAVRFAASDDLDAWSPWADAPPAGRFLRVEVTLTPGDGAPPELLELRLSAEPPGAPPRGVERRTWPA